MLQTGISSASALCRAITHDDRRDLIGERQAQQLIPDPCGALKQDGIVDATCQIMEDTKRLRIASQLHQLGCPLPGGLPQRVPTQTMPCHPQQLSSMRLQVPQQR